MNALSPDRRQFLAASGLILGLVLPARGARAAATAAPFQPNAFVRVTPDNLVTILVAAAPFALIALGQTLVILTGGIDLSVGSVIAVSAMSAAATAKANPGQVWLTVLVAVLVGLAVGCVNGILVSRINVPPFIATLGTLTAGSGLAYVIGGGAPINGLPSEFGSIANTKILGLHLPTTDLQIAASAYERQIDELVAADEDTAAYVASLEEAADDESSRDISVSDDASLAALDPSDLVEEVERFLRGD